tara:strand:- start:701 stop:1387 length:687 start_codon:yes stop_codon:yes gene_type:complete
MAVDPNEQEIKNICKSLIGSTIKINYELTLPNGENHSGEIINSNIIGNCMENILYPIIRNKIDTFEKGPPGQKPDFINSKSKTNGHCYEMKCFKKNPGFDIGSITGFLEDISKPDGVQEKLDVKYLIFEYSFDRGIVIIKEFWMLSVYEICCGYGGKKPINIGGHKGVYIRPTTKNKWTSINCKDKRNPTNFLDRIEKLIQSKFYKVDEDEKQQKLKSIKTQRDALGI